MELLLQPFARGFVSEEQHVADRDASTPLDVLFGAGLVLVAHVHDGGGFRPVRFCAKETVEILLDQIGNTTNCPLLARPILARNSFHLPLSMQPSSLQRISFLLLGAPTRIFSFQKRLLAEQFKPAFIQFLPSNSATIATVRIFSSRTPLPSRKHLVLGRKVLQASLVNLGLQLVQLCLLLKRQLGVID